MRTGASVAAIAVCLLCSTGLAQDTAVDTTAPPADSVQASGVRRWYDPLLDNFQFLPFRHFYVDLNAFAFHKNSFFRERYFLESRVEYDFSILSFREKLHAVMGVDLGIGMGKTPSDILFDPADIAFGIVPLLEYHTRRGLRLQIGNDHRCFHEIDRHDFPTVYWNRGFVAVGSHNYRIGDYWSALAAQGEEAWVLRNRLSWHLRGGHYFKRFFGLIDPSSLNGDNDRILSVDAQVRYAFYHRRSWVLDAYEALEVGSYREGPGDVGLYYVETLGVEAHFRRGKHGGMFFVTFTLDKMPPSANEKGRFSRDQLLEVGIALYM